MAFSKPILFVFLVSLSIFREIACNSSPLSFTRNEEASTSENNDCDKLKSTISALQSIIKEKHQELLTKEEKIRGLELFIREKSYLFESDIDFSQSENPVKYASEAEEKVYELQKQIFELRPEVEMQHKRRLEAETRAEIADKKVEELSPKLENIDGKWFSSILGLNANKTQAYLLSLWHQNLSPYLQKASTSDFIQGFDVSYYYLEVTRVMTTAKPHLENVKVYIESYTENVRHGFKKLVNVWRVIRKVWHEA